MGTQTTDVSALRALIDEQRHESFNSPEDATDAEALGLLVASHLEWNGLAILEAAYAALEDANYHTEASRVAGMLATERRNA